jgi:hypothetical protein
MRADLAEKLRAYEQERAAEHRRRLDNDAEYRERHARKRSIPSLPSGRRLPPWPLGPQGRVDNRFAEAVLRSATFQRLMRARPAATLEVLLAVLIEDAPEESFSSRRSYREELGLASDHEGYPTAYWEKPAFFIPSRRFSDGARHAFEAPVLLYRLLGARGRASGRWAVAAFGSPE